MRLDKPFQKIIYPYIRMVLRISSYKFIEVFANNKTLISDALNHTRNNDNINLLVLLKLLVRIWRWNFLNRVENDFYNLFWNWKQFYAFINQILFQKWGEWFYLLKRFRSKVRKRKFFQPFEEFLRIWDLVENFELIRFGF